MSGDKAQKKVLEIEAKAQRLLSERAISPTEIAALTADIESLKDLDVSLVLLEKLRDLAQNKSILDLMIGGRENSVDRITAEVHNIALIQAIFSPNSTPAEIASAVAKVEDFNATFTQDVVVQNAAGQPEALKTVGRNVLTAIANNFTKLAADKKESENKTVEVLNQLYNNPVKQPDINAEDKFGDNFASVVIRKESAPLLEEAFKKGATLNPTAVKELLAKKAKQNQEAKDIFKAVETVLTPEARAVKVVPVNTVLKQHNDNNAQVEPAARIQNQATFKFDLHNVMASFIAFKQVVGFGMIERIAANARQQTASVVTVEDMFQSYVQDEGARSIRASVRFTSDVKNNDKLVESLAQLIYGSQLNKLGRETAEGQERAARFF